MPIPSVYTLRDPLTGERRVVGATDVPLHVRVSNYCSHATGGRPGPIYDWIRGLLAAGARPEIEGTSFRDERAAIEALREEGCDLLNTYDGDGRLGRVARGWTPERDALIGTMPDGRLAELLGFSTSKVIRRRQQLRVPAYRGPRGPRTPIDWGEHDAKLGTMPDVDLAAAIGCSRDTVSERRARWGIPQFVGSYDYRGYALSDRPASPGRHPAVKPGIADDPEGARA